MFQRKLSLFIFILSLVACGGKYEAPHDIAAGAVDLQTTKPVQGLARIDCELELTTSEGQTVRLSDSSKVFEMNESAGNDWSESSVVMPLSTYSLLARYTKTALKPEATGPSFHVILCKGQLDLISECTEADRVKINERTGFMSSSISNELKANVQFQIEQHSIRQLNAVCTLNIQPLN